MESQMQAKRRETFCFFCSSDFELAIEDHSLPCHKTLEDGASFALKSISWQSPCLWSLSVPSPGAFCSLVLTHLCFLIMLKRTSAHLTINWRLLLLLPHLQDCFHYF